MPERNLNFDEIINHINRNDMHHIKEGDIVEGYIMEEVERK